MAAPVSIVTHPAPPQAPSWAETIADALEAALHEHAALVTQIRRFGPTGLLLAREQAEKRIVALTGQLAEERHRA